MKTMITYPFSSIIINGRTVTLESIASNTVASETEFENHTFHFIKQWLTSVDSFSITTSGSTGIPKTISITRSQMQSSAKMTIAFLGLKKNDTALVCLNTQFIAGQMMLVRAFEAGMHIVAQEPSADPLLTISKRIDFTAFVPLQIQAIIGGNTDSLAKLNRMKTILIGGAPVNNNLKKEIKKLKPATFATYGMTETISHIALQKLNGGATENYISLPGVQIKKDDRNCLVISVPYLSDKIITNDLVEIINDHEFQWVGRRDNIINSGGLKISAEKLEESIHSIEGLSLQKNFFIHSLPDEQLGQKLVLVIETEENIDREKILSVLKRSLSKYEVPKEIITRPKFSYTKTGKINREESISFRE